MIKDIIGGIFNNVSYWGEKEQLLRAIPSNYFENKNILLKILGITKEVISDRDEAKRDMWNYHIINNLMGDDILQNVSVKILDDIDFVKEAIKKYNRTYLFLNNQLKSNFEIAKLAAMHEKNIILQKDNFPILYYMPQKFQSDYEISTIATTRNIENLQYTVNLKRNKYFIYDMMNLLDDSVLKDKILQSVDKSLLVDKKFVASLGCYDNLCEQFRDDLDYVAYAAKYDISILRKTELFSEKIIKYALKNRQPSYARGYILAEVFRYIERFHHNYREFFNQVKDKELLDNFFWEMGEIMNEEFM